VSTLIGRICDACVTSIPVTGAAVSASLTPGSRSTIHATDAVAARVEDLQLDLGEGPGTDAIRDRGPILIADLSDARSATAARWPMFTPAALREGARAVFAFPLQLGAAEVGLLGLYRDMPGHLDGSSHATALRLADAAMFALIDDGFTSSDPIDRDDNERATDENDFFRTQVFQAVGMMTVQLGVSAEEATVRLRAHAYAHDRSVADVAGDVVSRRLRFRPDSA